MKKIIKSAALLLGACLVAGAVNAQLSSDKPALTVQQLSELSRSSKTNAAKSASSTTATVSVSSDKPSMTIQQQEQLAKRGNTEAKVEATKTETTTSPALPSQGDTKPVISVPATENKVQQVPMQSEKQTPAKQQ